MTTEQIDYLLTCNEPWTRYRTLIDLLDRPETDPPVQAARVDMLHHPKVRAMIAETATWGDRPLTRHNDAGHPIYKLSTLADFGVRVDDPGMPPAIQAVMDHRSPEGMFQTVVNIPLRFGGTGENTWTWILCDAPTLLYSLLAMGLRDDPRVQQAAQNLASLVDDNGWRCLGAPELRGFRGPGRKTDPCPIANLYALKALAQVPDLTTSPAAHTGAEMLLSHWQNQEGRKLYLFGIGTDFRKLKYPFVWYDLLHVASVLGQFPFVHGDPRFREMVQAITMQADAQGRFTANSMYMAWKGWSFADKKNPSPWLTFLVLRLLKAIATESS